MKRIISSFLLFLLIACTLSAADINSGSVYRIAATYTGNRTLMIENSSFDNAVKISAWTETGTNSQRWRITATGEGSYYIDNMYSGKRLLRSSDTSIAQSNLNTSNAYQWILTPVGGAGYENCFYISNKAKTDYVLELTPGKDIDSDASPVRLAAKDTEKLPRQIWKIEQSAELPNQLTPAMRDAMMKGWKDHYFKWLKEETTGFWGEAELIEIILDAYEATGKEEYKTMFEQAYKYFVSGSGGWGQKGNGKSWMWNEFNDDVAWAVLVSIRACIMFGTSMPGENINYLSIARSNFDNMYKRALYEVDGLYNLLRWKEGQGGTTSCVNGPSEVAACYFGLYYEKNNPELSEEYYGKAKMLYANHRRHMFEPNTGRVWDSFNGNWASPYNQGTYLGAAVMLYNHYGDEMYKKDAEKIIEFSRNNFCNSYGIITACDTDDGDLANFKAILLRYVRRYVVDMGKPEYGEWLQKNAVHAYNNRNSKGISRVEWKTKTGEVKIDDDGNEKEWNAYGAFAAVSAAMNAPLDVNTIYKNAFSTIQAGSFNYISKVLTENNTQGEELEITNIEKDAYLGYNFVDFQSKLADGIEFELANDGQERTIEIRLGSSKGDLLASVAIPASDGSFKTVSAVLDVAVDGMENVYLVFRGDKNGLKLKSFKFTKDNDNMLLPDITSIESGTLTCSETVKNLENLISDRLSKSIKIEKNNAWLQYEATSGALLNAYALASGNSDAASDPKAWRLLASNDGESWTEIDAQSNQTFDKRNQIKNYSLTPTEKYRYFRLDISENNGASNELNLAEWQLYGSTLQDNSLTKGNGTLTAQYNGDVNGEKYTEVIDNKADTKYLVKDKSDLWLQYETTERYVLKSYSITSADDNPERDPKNWTLYASTDGSEWNEIDHRENERFGARGMTRTYNSEVINNPYRYFKLHITDNNGASDTQMAEWQLFGDLYYDFYYQDFTKSGGVLSSSANDAASGIAPLTDNNPETYYSIQAGSLPVWIQYESAVPFQLKAYSITSSGENSSFDPKSWKLEASNDGENWVSLDTRTNQVFENRYLRKDYEKSNNALYTYFRLQITAANSSEMKIAEWQLYGTYINSYDVTSDAESKIIEALWRGNYTEEDGTVKVDERYEKLTNKNRNQKYCVNGARSFWVVFQSARPVKLTGYSLMSGNDQPERDPKKWTLSGSNNRMSWTVLDAQDNQAFQSRQSTQYYPVSSDKKYKFFKLDVEDNQGVKSIQLTEWQLFGEFNEYSEDITENGGTLTASHEATDGTALENLIDNNETSRYYIDITNTEFGSGIWLKYESPAAVLLSSYSLTSSNGQPNNDPKSWKLQASNDDINWVDIDEKENISFDKRCEYKLFEVNPETAYKYFRLYVTARKSTALGFQLAEWELFGTSGSGIFNPDEAGALEIYPNPATDYIMINVPEEADLNIYNLSGTLLQSQKLQRGDARINLEHYRQGAYIVKLESVNFTKTQLLIKK